MRKIIFFVNFLIILSGFNVFAVKSKAPASAQTQTQALDSNVKAEFKSKLNPEAESVSFSESNKAENNSSEVLRQDKKFMFTLQPIGYGPNPALTNGLSGAYFINPNNLILVDTLFSEQSDSETYKDSIYKRSGSSIGIHYKTFVQNSLYLRTGVDYRKFKYSHEFNYSSNSMYNYFREIEGYSTIYGLAIGNQWQWSNFTLGCDWFGGYIPISSKITKVTERGYSLASDPKEIEDRKDEFFRKAGVTAVRFYLGYSF